MNLGSLPGVGCIFLYSFFCVSTVSLYLKNIWIFLVFTMS